MNTLPETIPSVSVLMPTFEQCHFIERALDSLLAQSMTDWELVIIDDGSRDATAALVQPYLADPRIRYHAFPDNTGLGHALNAGLARARAPLIACLPSDDVYYHGHLRRLRACFLEDLRCVLAIAGVRHHYNREAAAQIPGTPLQLVQCMHRSTALRWIERAQLESDDLDRLFWARLREEGSTSCTGTVSCEWVDHPHQRHKRMQEPAGGINSFRQHYRVREPLRFHSTVGNLTDEVEQYRALRERPPGPRAADGLRILLVGELAYNADRVLALADLGHELHGLWMPDPHWYNSVGPLPFGHVQELPRDNWREAIDKLRPDLIYGLLNWQAVPFAHEVMLATRGIPFVWHFKEGPFICLEKGSWPQLNGLFRQAEGCIFSSPEMRDWFDTVIPGLSSSKPCHVLDGDLPRQAWFDGERSALLSETGRGRDIHTVVPGRPIGLHPQTVAQLAEQGIHLHFYGDYTQGQWRQWIEHAQARAPRHLHLHGNVDQRRWVEEFSRYDAGWLHAIDSRNGGEIRRADWDDLNLPARLATLAAAGLPMIQKNNRGAIVAARTLTERLGIGVFYDTIEELGVLLRDSSRMAPLRERVWRERRHFTFDTHAPALSAYFAGVVARAGQASDAL